MLLVLSMVCHIQPRSCRAMPRPAVPMPYPIKSFAMSPLRLEFVTRLRSATQISRCPWRERHPQLSTPLLSWHPATSTEHIPATHLRQTSLCAVPSVTGSQRATLNTVKNTTMSTLHIRSLLLPSQEAHARVLAQLMTTCHNRRLQRFCEGNGASVPHTVEREIQLCEGAVCLGILDKWKHQSQRANDCMPSRRSRAELRQFLHIRMSVKRRAVPDPAVSSHVKCCLTGHCPTT